MKVLEVKNVSYSYHTTEQETKAVDNVSFEVNEGEFFGIVGPSGCGKTTILNLLAGIYVPVCGQIVLQSGKKPESSAGVGLMPQRDQLFQWRTIEKNVLLGPEIRGKKNAADKKFARDLLEKYGLKEFSKKHPSELSGGMRQRAALIRTLVTRPEILLLDEPFSALDFQTRLNVCDDVYSIIRKERKTAILVSHDINESISLCDRIVVLSKRPARVVETIDIDLDKRLSPLEKRECADFSFYFKKIWKLLEE